MPMVLFKRYYHMIFFYSSQADQRSEVKWENPEGGKEYVFQQNVCDENDDDDGDGDDE